MGCLRYRPITMDELRIGVLIIGSLYWDPLRHRSDWRRDYLNLDGERCVSVPIRYGRQSESRADSYTMVFSLTAQPGRAIVVPCSRPVRKASDLVDEAVGLWTAETRTGKNPERRISAKDEWGCVALRANPQHPLADELRAGWTEKVSRESGYRRPRSADGEEDAVDVDGFLTIPWPESEDGLDLGVDVLLATATDPMIKDGRYPSAQQIADAWNTRGGRNHIDYFCKNRAHGIRTFEDDIIESRLRELWQ